jgi:hypothetical protein
LVRVSAGILEGERNKARGKQSSPNEKVYVALIRTIFVLIIRETVDGLPEVFFDHKLKKAI